MIISRHLEKEDINTLKQAQSKTTQCLRGSPHPGDTSTNSSYFFSSVNRLQAQSHQNPSLHRTKDLCSSLDPSSMCYSTKPSTIGYNHLHLDLQVSYSHAQSTYNPTCT
jgi:hypothetical protein